VVPVVNQWDQRAVCRHPGGEIEAGLDYAQRRTKM
jgi:hypothetical protein